MPVPTLPAEIAKRPLHFFWLVDTSGSMSGRKIDCLNTVIRECIPAITSATGNYPEVQVLMRCIKFSSQAQWHIGPDAIKLDLFQWSDLSAGGVTATASAIRMLNDQLDIERMPRRGFPPVCLLLSDGFCTESDEKYEQAINQLNSLPWGKRAVRLAVAIGDEQEYDEEQLLKFVNHPEVGLLKAHNATELVHYVKWASVAASVSSSVGKSVISNSASNVILPTPPPPPNLDADPGDVF